MTRPTRAITAVMVVAVFLLAASAVLGQTEPDYDLTWWTVDGGGTMVSASADGLYELAGTIGQPDAGLMSDAGERYTLRGGFETGGGAATEEIYLPLVLRTS